MILNKTSTSFKMMFDTQLRDNLCIRIKIITDARNFNNFL